MKLTLIYLLVNNGKIQPYNYIEKFKLLLVDLYKPLEKKNLVKDYINHIER
ncbi:hypothetical protein JL09_g6694 [Pichia kudriavzevii]|uniref:Uncharacterized protein n=1 Tax=Pichia kudriavzevii TaxID=4909 RepID=A0A099NKS3_PICKU|nr:hypothetical protein JL09_g6694 [Pichia kudriavzevii]